MSSPPSNHILLSWVEHAYTYGLHYLNHHYTNPSQADTIYQEITNEQIHWLGVHGVPPAIPKWDGWYTPTDKDVAWVNILRAVEEEQDQFCQYNSPATGFWLGKTPISTDSMPATGTMTPRSTGSSTMARQMAWLQQDMRTHCPRWLKGTKLGD